MLSLTTSKQNKTRLALYAVVISSQIAYNMLLVLTPFVNDYLGTSGLQYSLSFSGYYFTVLLSKWCIHLVISRFIVFWTDQWSYWKTEINQLVSFYFGAWYSMLCICYLAHVIMYWTRDVNVYIICRIVAGGFDTVQYLSQAVIADITNIRERPKYLAQLESMINTSQTIGPLLAGVLSKYHLYLPLYLCLDWIIPRWVAVGLYALSLVISIIFLPESIPSVIEKDQLMATFELVEQHSRWFLYNW